MVTPLTRTIEANPRSHTVTLGDADLPAGDHPRSRPTPLSCGVLIRGGQVPGLLTEHVLTADGLAPLPNR
jgi:hypothetical protein